MRPKFLTALAAVMGAVAPLIAGATPAMAATNELEVPNEVMRGQVIVYKYDGETRESKPQGGASLEDAEFTITNKSDHPVVYINEFGQKQTYAVGQSWVIKSRWDDTLQAYVAKTPVDGLPYGTYHIQETKSSTGYGLADNNTWLKHTYIPGYLSEADRKWVTTGYDFSITEDGQTVTYKGEAAQTDTPGCYNPPIRGGIEAVKRDHDWLRPSSQGNATLEGGVFEIYNASDNPIQLWDHFDQSGEINHGVLATPGIDNNEDGVADSDVDDEGWVQPGGKVATIVTGEDGRAQTFMDALPVGWYKVVEVKAPKGYALEKQWYAYVNVTEDDWDVCVVTDCDDPVLRGGVEFKKSDADLGYDSTDPQGDAVLSGATITIYNQSDRDVFMKNEDTDAIDYAKGTVKPGDVVATVKTDQYGYAEVFGLPYGHYRAVETSPSEGYNLNTDWVVEFDINENQGGTLTADGENIVTTCCGEDKYLPESVIRGDIEISKKDWETGESTALGGATLAGAEFSVTNVSDNPVVFGGQTYDVNSVVTTLVTDENGYAKAEDLPYGTYIIRETKAPQGYVLNNQWFAVVVIREEGVVVSGTEACPDSILTNDMYHGADGNLAFPSFDFSGNNNVAAAPEARAMSVDPTPHYRPSDNAMNFLEDYYSNLIANSDDPSRFVTIGTNLNGDYTKFCAPVDKVSRNDLRFNKVSSDGSKPLSGIPFVLRSKTTGEWHVLVTDENGLIDTTAWMADGDNLPSQGDYTWNLHSQNTNASDAAVTENGDGTFTVTDASKLDPKAGVYFFGSADADRGALDYVSALPYDDYELIELRVDGNKGMDLINRDVTLKYADNNVVDLGTITNDSDQPDADCPPNGTTIEAHKTVDAGANAKLDLGQEVTFTVSYKNTGATAAEHVRVRDYVSDGYEFVSADNDGVYVSAEDSANGKAYVEWVTGEVAPGAEGSVSFKAKVSTSTGKSILTNQAHFDAESGDVEAGNPDNDDPAGRTNIVYNTTDGSETPSALDASKWVEGTADDGSAEIGDTLTYHVKVTNVGGKTSGEVQISDIIPTGTTLASRQDDQGYDVPDISDGGQTVGNYAVSWTLDPLKPGESHDVWFKVTVNDNAFSVVRNSATYGEHCGVDVSTNLNNKTNTVETPIVKHPDLTVEKTADAEKVSAGQTVTYTIKITNNGHGNATNVAVEDVLPEGVHYIDGSASGDVTGSIQRGDDGKCHIMWTIPSIAHDGGTATVTFQAHVDQLEAGTVIKNTATATPEGEDTVTSNELDLPVVDALEGLDITKTSDVADGDRVMPGDEIHYTIEWTNNGDTPIYNLGVRDEIPEHTTFVPGSIVVTGTDGKTSTDVEGEHTQDGEGSEDGKESGSADGDAFECPIWAGDSAVGDKTDFSAIKNIVSEGDGSATVSGDGIDSFDSLFGVIAKLEAGKSIEFTVHHADGYDKLWKIVIQSDGSALLTFAIIAPSIEDGPEASIGNGIVGNYDKTTDAVYAVQDEIKPGESGKLEFTVKVDDDVPDNTTISNHATYDDGVVGMPTGDLEHETNTVDTLVGAAVLEGSKSVDKTVVAEGSVLTYTVKVSNTGTGKATGVGIYDQFRTEVVKGCVLLPDSVSVTGGTSAEDSAEAIRALNAASDHVAVYARELPAGETMTLTFKVLVADADAGDTITNKASFGDELTGVPEGALDQETNETSVTVSEPKLSITAMSDPVGGSDVERGDEITYTFTVTNDADVAASGVAVNAEIPTHTTFVSAMGGLTDQGNNTVGMTGISLGAHESRTFTVKVRVNDDVTRDTVLGFRATTGMSDRADIALDVDSNEVDHIVSQVETKLTVAASSDPATGSVVYAGDEITYTFSVTNQTAVDVSGIAVRDVVPVNTTYVVDSATGGLGEVALEDGRVVLGVTDLDFKAGETKTFSFKVTVNDDVADGMIISDVAEAGQSASAEDALAVKSDAMTHSVDVHQAHLKIEASSDPESGSTVKSGDRITYTVKISNDGEADAEGVALNTTVDKNTVYVAGSGTNGIDQVAVDAEGRVVLGATGITVAKGESVEFTYQVQVKDGVEDGTLIANQASCGISNTAMSALDLKANEIKHGVTAEQATLSIKAEATPQAGATVKPGSQIDYTFTVTNTSGVDAHGVAVHTEMPHYSTLVDGSLKGADDLGDGVFGKTGIDIAAGQSYTFGFSIVVNDLVPAGYTLQVRGTTGFATDASEALAIDSNEIDHNLESVPPELAIKLDQEPADGSVVAPGDTITYTVTVTNEGDTRAKNVGIYDIAPIGTKLVDGTLAAGSEDDTTHFVADKTFGQVLCVMAGDLNPGETATMTYQVKVDLDFAGIIRNQALWVSPAADPDASADDEGMSDMTFDFGQIMDSDEETDDTTEVAGTRALVGFDAFAITDDSWAGGSNVTGDAGNGSGGSNTGSVIVKPGSGSDTDDTETTQPSKPGDVTEGVPSEGGTGSTNTDGSGESNQVDTDVNKPQIELTKSTDVADGAYVRPGDVVTYTIKASNVGATRANGFVVEDALPEGIEFVKDSVDATDGFEASYDAESNTVKLTGTLEAGSTCELTFQAKVTATDGTIANTAKWYQTDGETTVEGDESNTAEINVGDTVIELTKSADVADGAYVTPGQVITYTLSARNMGSVVAKPTVSDVLPEGVTLDESSLPASATYDAETRTITFATTEINSGEAAQYSFKVTVNDDVAFGTEIVNRAHWADKDNNDEGDSNDHLIKVGEPVIVVSKIADKTDAVKIGDAITYTVTLENRGTADGTMKVADVMPAGLALVEQSLTGTVDGTDAADLSGMTAAKNQIEGTLSVKAGSTVTLTYQAIVTGYVADANVTEITNTFNVDVDGVDEDPAPGTSTVQVEETPEPEPEPVVDSLGFSANADDATGEMEPMEGTTGDELTVPECGFTREGYTFTGWNTVSDGTGDTYQPGDTYTLTDGTDMLYAQWKAVETPEPEMDTLTYNANTGADAEAIFVDRVDAGTKATVKDNEFSRDGYTFTGWNTKADGTGDAYAAGDEYQMTDGDDVLFAQWEKNAEPEPEMDTLTYDANTGAEAESIRQVKVEAGTTTQVADNEFKNGEYTFVGWNTKADGTGDAYAAGDEYTMTDGDDVLYAQWIMADQLVLDGNAPDVTGEMAPIDGATGEEVDVPECTFTRLNYTFAGWNTVSDGTGDAYQPGDKYTLTEGADVLFAQWKKNDEPVEEQKVTVEKQGLSDSGRTTDLYTPGESQRYAITVTNDTQEAQSLIVEDAAGEGMRITSVTDADGNAVATEDATDEVTEDTPADGEGVEPVGYEQLSELYNQWIIAGAPELDDPIMAELVSALDELAKQPAMASITDADGSDLSKLIATIKSEDATFEEKSAAIESLLKALESEQGDSAATAEDATEDTTAETPALDAQSVCWTTGELGAGESATYYVTVDVAANATGTITNVANVYGADTTKPLDSSTATLDEADTFQEAIKKGYEDMPTTGIALGALALVGAGAAAITAGVRSVRKAEKDDESDEAKSE